MVLVTLLAVVDPDWVSPIALVYSMALVIFLDPVAPVAPVSLVAPMAPLALVALVAPVAQVVLIGLPGPVSPVAPVALVTLVAQVALLTPVALAAQVSQVAPVAPVAPMALVFPVVLVTHWNLLVLPLHLSQLQIMNIWNKPIYNTISLTIRKAKKSN